MNLWEFLHIDTDTYIMRIILFLPKILNGEKNQDVDKFYKLTIYICKHKLYNTKKQKS